MRLAGPSPPSTQPFHDFDFLYGRVGGSHFAIVQLPSLCRPLQFLHYYAKYLSVYGGQGQFIPCSSFPA